MECPVCQNNNSADQKFCGDCGQQLEKTCPHCSAFNPPAYNFCGQCGADLAMTGTITLARSGLISQINNKALDLLGYDLGEMQGRPFSLFVDRDDLVIFFSHWNEVLNHCRPQSFEVAMKTREAKTIYIALECSTANSTSGDPDEFSLTLKEVTESRAMAVQMQQKQDLLSLVFAISDSIGTVSKQHLDKSIEDALKKICLITKSDCSFIYSISRRLKRIVPAYQWRQPSAATEKAEHAPVSVPFEMIRRAIVRLRKNQTYVISDVTKLPPSERYELLAWHQVDLGAWACHLIYAEKRPIGLIGLGKNKAGEPWDDESVALIKFFGQLISPKLPFASTKTDNVAPDRSKAENTELQYETPPPVAQDWEKSPAPQLDRPIGDTEQQPPDINRTMLLERLAGRPAADQQPVFPRDDGLVLLTCPRCGFQESVSIVEFNRLGNAVKVTCACKKRFSALLEKRRAYRKVTNLDGFFTLRGDLSLSETQGSIWGQMVVKDISKKGLRFWSQRADLLHVDDVLAVRFNLDNPNQSLINKPARVVSVSEARKEVGCRFEGADNYDITLGFYFI